jgi:hypothetical protein
MSKMGIYWKALTETGYDLYFWKFTPVAILKTDLGGKYKSRGINWKDTALLQYRIIMPWQRWEGITMMNKGKVSESMKWLLLNTVTYNAVRFREVGKNKNKETNDIHGL